MSLEQLDKFFKEYEAAFNELDLKTISGFYSDAFISTGPKGVIAHSKKEFEKKAEQAVDFYKSVGQRSAKIISKRVMPICNEYSMVVIRWGMTFEKTAERVIEFDASYIIYEKGLSPQIILIVSHKDEEEIMKRSGLKSQIPGKIF